MINRLFGSKEGKDERDFNGKNAMGRGDILIRYDVWLKGRKGRRSKLFLLWIIMGGEEF